ncbi:MAG: YhbY family RNA-binding protein [Bacteroidia bacterium]|nr:MAG: YhbY family RNA-binding protein [Bacteroidia bacterium]
MNISSKERAYLRKISHGVEPVVRIGKEGIDDNLIESVANAVKKREIVKVKILQNSEVKADREVGEMIAHRAEAIFVDSIGKILIFFKPDNKKGKITKEFNEFKRKGKKQKND